MSGPAFLNNFFEEHKESKIESKSKPEVAAVKSSGKLLIAGCNDFDGATSKTAGGLEGPHLVALGTALHA